MTTTTRPAHRGLLVMVFVLVFSAGLFAQSRSAAASPSPSPVARDLNTILAELLRASPATSQDLTDLQQSGGKLRRVEFWRGENAQKTQVAAAVRRNLQFAVPDLIHDAQASGGSISTTFKLYKDLTVVCESLDSLLPSGSRQSKELTALNNDITDMNRLTEQLSVYIQQTAAAMESKNGQLVSAAGHLPKKIIVDDTLPEKPSPTKRRPSNQ